VRRFPTAASILLVLAVYAFIGSRGTFSFRSVPRDYEYLGYYARLAESFLRGRTDLGFPLDERWSRVVNAYDFDSRKAQGMEWASWDASLYRGKFYLYFSPLPVVLFYIPFRLVAGAYPPDSLVTTFACAWAFLAGVAFLRRAIAERRTWVPFPFWVLLLGLGNVVPFLLGDVRIYEVAIATGMALAATWAYALLRFVEAPSPRRALWMGLFLALTIATRPNLIVLLLVALWLLASTKERRARMALFAVIPLILVGTTMAAYNYARFGSVFELGMTYQISFEPMWRHPPCSLCDVPEAIRFVNNVVHYMFWSPHFSQEFPYVGVQPTRLDPAVSFRSAPDFVVGAGVISPLLLVGSLCALVLAARRGAKDAGVRAALFVAGASWLILSGLATCRWITPRYSLDFMLLMTMASVVCIEHALSMLARADVRIRLLSLVAIGLIVYSTAAGTLLGFRGVHGAELQTRLRSLISPG